MSSDEDDSKSDKDGGGDNDIPAQDWPAFTELVEGDQPYLKLTQQNQTVRRFIANVIKVIEHDIAFVVGYREHTDKAAYVHRVTLKCAEALHAKLKERCEADAQYYALVKYHVSLLLSIWCQV